MQLILHLGLKICFGGCSSEMMTSLSPFIFSHAPFLNRPINSRPHFFFFLNIFTKILHITKVKRGANAIFFGYNTYNNGLCNI